MHRADHDGLMAVRAFLQHAVQMILLPQRLKQRHAAGQADLADAPVAAVGVQHPIGQQRLMRAVERAEAKVHDAAAQSPAVIARLPDGARYWVLAIVFISSPKHVRQLAGQLRQVSRPVFCHIGRVAPAIKNCDQV